MPARALIALTLVGASLAGCGGGGEDAVPTVPPQPSPQPAELLTEASFAEVVAAEVRKGTELSAEPASLAVHVEEGLNSVDFPLEDAYASYRAEPDLRDEIVAAAAAAARERLDDGIAEIGLEEAWSLLMPLLKPTFDLRRLPAEPAMKRFSRTLQVVYAVDDESEFTLVTAADVSRWGTTLAEVDRLAQENLVRNTEKLLCEEELCGWASGDGYDATRLTSAELREDITEEIGPAVYAVPQENVFVALPIELADRIRQRVLEQFTTADDPVSPDVFVERNGIVVVLPK